ncbi:MAG: CPBP family intramembrane metalloprotease [Methanobrevibacter sp.]|nr:CPBP family intramembrane metalloprotease [Methanobrevibacter sp.]
MSEFLNNVREGENGWKGYTVTILLTMFFNSFTAIYYLFFIIGFYFILTNIAHVQDNFSEGVHYFLTMILSFGISYLFLILSANAFHKRDFISLVNVSEKYNFRGNLLKWYQRIRWNKFFKGMGVWLVYMIITLFVPCIIDPSKFVFNPNLSQFIILLVLVLITIPIQASFEEVFFRGYLNQGLSLKIKKPIKVIIISSIIFGLGHIINGGFVLESMILNTLSAFLFGIICSLTTLLYGGVEFSSGAHIINNILAFTMIGYADSPDNFGSLIIQTSPLNYNFELIWAIVPTIIFLILLINYKWNEIKLVLKG